MPNWQHFSLMFNQYKCLKKNLRKVHFYINWIKGGNFLKGFRAWSYPKAAVVPASRVCCHILCPFPNLEAHQKQCVRDLQVCSNAHKFLLSELEYQHQHNNISTNKESIIQLFANTNSQHMLALPIALSFSTRNEFLQRTETLEVYPCYLSLSNVWVPFIIPH